MKTLLLLLLPFFASAQLSVQGGLNLSTMSAMAAMGVTTSSPGLTFGVEYRTVFGGGYLQTVQPQVGYRFQHFKHRCNMPPSATTIMASAGVMQYREDKRLVTGLGYGVTLRHMVNGGFMEIGYREKWLQVGVGFEFK
jgi:hypothetical protein